MNATLLLQLPPLVHHMYVIQSQISGRYVLFSAHILFWRVLNVNFPNPLSTDVALQFAVRLLDTVACVSS